MPSIILTTMWSDLDWDLTTTLQTGRYHEDTLVPVQNTTIQLNHTTHNPHPHGYSYISLVSTNWSITGYRMLRAALKIWRLLQKVETLPQVPVVVCRCVLLTQLLPQYVCIRVRDSTTCKARTCSVRPYHTTYVHEPSPTQCCDGCLSLLAYESPHG